MSDPLVIKRGRKVENKGADKSEKYAGPNSILNPKPTSVLNKTVSSNYRPLGDEEGGRTLENKGAEQVE